MTDDLCLVCGEPCLDDEPTCCEECRVLWQGVDEVEPPADDPPPEWFSAWSDYEEEYQ